MNPTAKHARRRRAAFVLVLLLPIVGAVTWTCHPAAKAVLAVLTWSPLTLSLDDLADPRRLQEVRRAAQRHFLAHTVYIPMEDIVAASPGPAEPAETASLLMQKACGPGRLFIWIPFKFYLPVTGEKVVEWCWRPQTKDA